MFNQSRLILAGSVLLLLVSCAGIAPKFYDLDDNEINDETLGLTRQDYRDLPFTKPTHSPDMDAGYNDFKTEVSGAANEPPIPDVAPILAAPSAPKLGQTKLVSLAVTDDVPLKDVFLELARLADVDVEVDANISGGIAFRANQRPFNEVIERICDFAGLRYSMRNSVLRIERDEPFVQIYSLDFLNLDRSSTSSVNVSTSVLSAGSGGGSSSSGSSDSSSGSSSSGGSSGGGGGLNTGSTASISSTTESDFWEQFEASITGILKYQPQTRMSEFSPEPAQTGMEEGAGMSAPPVPDALASTPTATAPSNTSTSTGGPTLPTDVSALYTLNRQAGTLTAVANSRQHRLIEEFIKTLEFNASAQVLIEAKIVEVTLNEEFENGIDWNRLGGNAINFNAMTFGGLTTTGNSLNFSLQKNNLTGMNIDLDLAIKLTQHFGTTRTLSSPRLHAINNQQAVLTFAKNEVYFTIEVEREEQDATATTTSQTTYTINSTINTVPIGIIMTVLPSINRRTGEVTLNVRPTLSRVVDRVSDPGLAVTLATDPELSDLDVDNLIPVVEVRELDSILKVKSGEVMVIGGLMEDLATQGENGIPGVSDVPVVGNLFKGVDRARQTKELIIFIRPTVMGSLGSADSADKSLYDKFTQDPRPLNF